MGAQAACCANEGEDRKACCADGEAAPQDDSAPLQQPVLIETAQALPGGHAGGGAAASASGKREEPPSIFAPGRVTAGNPNEAQREDRWQSEDEEDFVCPVPLPSDNGKSQVSANDHHRHDQSTDGKLNRQKEGRAPQNTAGSTREEPQEQHRPEEGRALQHTAESTREASRHSIDHQHQDENTDGEIISPDEGFDQFIIEHGQQDASPTPRAPPRSRARSAPPHPARPPGQQPRPPPRPPPWKPEFTVKLYRMHVSKEDAVLGLDLRAKPPHLYVKSVRRGLVLRWNEENVDSQVSPGDMIMSVNGLDDANTMIKALAKEKILELRIARS